MKTHTYSDFDAFMADVSDIDAIMMLQNPRRRFWSMSHVNLPGVHVQLGRLGSGNIAEGQSLPAGYSLYLPLTAGCAYSANGTAINPGSLMVLEPGCEFCIATKDEHDWCSIFVPTTSLTDGGSFAESFRVPERTRCRVSPPNPELARQFTSLVRDVRRSGGMGLNFEATPAAQQAAEVARRIVLSIIRERQPDGAGQSGRPEVPRQEIIHRCRGLLEQREGERIRINELSAAASVSERTLRTAFNEYFGVGPVRYLLLRQLHQVHRALRNADADTQSVAEVLFQHGVWELSRFARRYRETFGELPSQTLRKAS